MNTMKTIIGAIGTASIVSGCVTISTLAESETHNKVYSGTIRHAELKCAHATCMDFPFSLVADTVLLPVTIPWSLVNLFKLSATDKNKKEMPLNSYEAPVRQ